MEAKEISRKLSPSELVYDFEHINKWHIFSNALRFRTTHDLTLSNEMIRQCLLDWCKLNPFLRTKILTSSTDSKSFSLDRKFVLLKSLDRIDVMKNVEIYRHVNWKSFYEREFNRQSPLNYDPDNDDHLLWRLILIKMNERSNDSQQKHEFCLIFTIHHGITDGRNAFFIMLELLKLIERSILGEKRDVIEYPNEIPLPLEDLLNEKLPSLSFSSSISSHSNDFNNETCKIPATFSPMCHNSEISGRIDNQSENINNNNISSNGFVTRAELFPSIECVTRFESFVIDRAIVNKVSYKTVDYLVNIII